ncbi:hypothetical protein JCM6882_002095 [Rhodosporidiobolus microsporus]
MSTTVELRRSPRQHPPPSLLHHTHRFSPGVVPPLSSTPANSRLSLTTAKGKERARLPFEHPHQNRIQASQLSGGRGEPARKAGDTDGARGVDESCVASGSGLAGQGESWDVSAPPLRPTKSLPSLLAHLSASPLFACAPSTSPTSFTFAPPPLAGANYPTLSAAPSSPSPSSSSCTCTSPKRPSSSPSTNAHVPSPERTKKRKIRHGFFRSSSLFTPPSPSPSPSAPSSARPRSAGEGTTPPSWWPSVSRSFGQGTESRFAPKEEEWTGNGEGWVAQLSLQLTSLSVSPEPVEETPSFLGDENGGPRRPRAGLARPTPTRSSSSPAWLGQRAASVFEVAQPEPPQALVELEGPALKQVLLKNLRARLTAEGGTSKAGEAGLRFKKWVVWNSFNRRQRELFSPSSSSDSFEGDDDHFGDGDGDADDDLELDFADAIFGSTPAGQEEQSGDAAMSMLMQEDFDFAPSSEELPTPPDGIAEDPLAALSGGGNEDGSSAAFTALLPAFELPLASPTDEADSTPRSLAPRPGLRRTTSLPNVSLSSSLSSSSSPAAPSPSAESQAVAWTAAAPVGGMVVACEG